jgi:hypothetical protein
MKGNTMKSLKWSIQALGAVACGALVLGLLSGDAMAGKRPSRFWPAGSQLVLDYYAAYGGWPSHVNITWPLANGADHYRLTVVQKGKSGSGFVGMDESPANYTIGYDGLADRDVFLVSGSSYSITVTVYSGPDEAVADSESLQGSVHAY